MKIGIITFHRAINYGAVLQAFALYNVLLKIGVKPYIIDYISPKLTERHHMVKFSFNPRKFYTWLKYGKDINKRFEKFQRFIEELDITPKVYNAVSLKEVSQSFDGIICGSDQVWNLKITGKDYNFYLNSIPDHIHKMSYAASFGLSEIPHADVLEVKRCLRRFQAISVREVVGQDIVESMIGERPQLVLDPTLLLSKEEWMRYSIPYVIKEPYLFLYSVGEIEDLFPLAEKIRRKFGYKIAVISYRRFKDIRDAIYLKDLSPRQFVYVANNAAAILTNSFHGTAFSVTLRKNFIVKLRNEIAHPGLNSRVITLLDSVGLLSQIYSDTSADITDLLNIDWKKPEKKLISLREQSINYLKKSLTK